MKDHCHNSAVCRKTFCFISTHSIPINAWQISAYSALNDIALSIESAGGEVNELKNR